MCDGSHETREQSVAGLNIIPNRDQWSALWVLASWTFITLFRHWLTGTQRMNICWCQELWWVSSTQAQSYTQCSIFLIHQSNERTLWWIWRCNVPPQIHSAMSYSNPLVVFQCIIAFQDTLGVCWVKCSFSSLWCLKTKMDIFPLIFRNASSK